MLQNFPDIHLSSLWKAYAPVQVVDGLVVIFDANLSLYDYIVKTVWSCISSLAQIGTESRA